MSLNKAPTRSGRSKGMALLREVYAELYEVLGQLYSPREILIAAQKIIDIHSSEYSDQIYEESPHYATEYSRSVDSMIAIHPWSVLQLEFRCDNLGDERLSYDDSSLLRLKRYYNPDTYLHRG